MSLFKTRSALVSVLACMFATAAHAQSSVTLFGMLDVGLSFVSNVQGGRELAANDSVFTPSLIGLRGAEDLGSGYKAVFELESQFAVENGTAIPGPGMDFSREASVGIEKANVGTLSFGQQYNLLYDFLFAPPAQFDATFQYGGLYNMRQGPFAALGIPQNATGAMDLDQMAGTTQVSNSLKFSSASFDGLTLGALYGFGGSDSFSSNNTVGLGADYLRGNFGVGAAYNETRYAALGDGKSGIRNFGAGVHQRIGGLYLSGLYTNTENTLSGATVQALQAGAMVSFSPSLQLGANYQYWRGNAALEHNHAQQLTSALQYSLSPRTLVYLEAAYQWTGGDVAGDDDAWINGVGQSNSTRQAIAQLGIHTSF